MCMFLLILVVRAFINFGKRMKQVVKYAKHSDSTTSETEGHP